MESWDHIKRDLEELKRMMAINVVLSPAMLLLVIRDFVA